jgi:hypothetical protein
MVARSKRCPVCGERIPQVAVECCSARVEGRIALARFEPKRVVWVCFKVACSVASSGEDLAQNALHTIRHCEDGGLAADLLGLLCSHSNEFVKLNAKRILHRGR